MQVQSYLFFEGRCEEALTFYRQALGAEVTFMMRFKEMPEPKSPDSCPPGLEEKIMHATLKIGETTLMVSDGRCQTAPKFQGFALSINAKDAAEAQRHFAALGQGGAVQMPLAKTFWSPMFGMVTDKFGVLWMVSVMQ